MSDILERRLFFDDSGAIKPDWESISRSLCEKFPESTREAAFRDAAIQWLQYLRESFGASFVVAASQNFLLLSDVAKDKRQSTLEFCEKALAKIEERLGDARWKTKLGPHVVMLFSNSDQYYSYIAGFYPDGDHAQSSGLFLRRGYAHIALPVAQYGMAHILVHELTHNCLAHLPIPSWINEGMARTFERLICGFYTPVLDGDLAERHHEFWTPERIQDFWKGAAFNDSSANELSYSLTEIFIELAAQERKDFAGFLAHATYKDRGAAAAKQYLGKSLGELAGTFLGPGDWEPKIPESGTTA